MVSYFPIFSRNFVQSDSHDKLSIMGQDTSLGANSCENSQVLNQV